MRAGAKRTKLLRREGLRRYTPPSGGDPQLCSFFRNDSRNLASKILRGAITRTSILSGCLNPRSSRKSFKLSPETVDAEQIAVREREGSCDAHPGGNCWRGTGGADAGAPLAA